MVEMSTPFLRRGLGYDRAPMRVEVHTEVAEAVAADVLAIPLADPPQPLELDERLAELIASGEARTDVGHTALLHVDGKIAAKRIALVGVGERERVDADVLRTAAGALVREAGKFGGTVAWALDSSLPVAPEEQGRALVEGTVIGGYDPGRWKTNAGVSKNVEAVFLCGGISEEAAQRAATVSDWVNRARDLANAPPNELTPARLAERAEEIAAGSEHLTVRALGPDKIIELGMGAFAGVAQGSHNPARLIVMRYDPPSATSDVVLGLVGKAITFDSGGISIKPPLYMEDMKGDMAGGGAVIEATAAIAELRLPLPVITVVAACENLLGGGSYRPGDILTAMNGKTIEIIDTDAEGRLVLADALWYAREQGATHLLDLATLTGAMERALGDQYAGLFANDEAWRDEILAAAETSGDHAWPLPLHPRYRVYIESTFADVKNKSIRLQAIPAYAAEFLQEFAGEGPWAHLDIAGTAFLTWPRPDYLSTKGGTGYGVRLIVELATRLGRR
jgi:leucyl aminopeptidase